MRGTEDTITMLIAMLLTASLVAIAIRIAAKPIDLIITQHEIKFIGFLKVKIYKWSELTVPKSSYIRSTGTPGRCVEMRIAALPGSRSAPIRIFDWYDVNFDRILDFIAITRGVRVEPLSTGSKNIPNPSSDRMKPRARLVKMAAFFTFTVIGIVQALDVFGLAEPIREVKVDAADFFDRRPVEMVLIVGNSRTSDNNMPGMLRAIADADHFPKKIHFKLATVHGSTLETLWAMPRVQALLAAEYDGAIVQGESRAQSDDVLAASYLTYGQKLLPAIKLRSGRPRLVINWTYDAALYKETHANRAEHYEQMQRDQLLLAKRTNAEPINIGVLWEKVHAAQPQLVLTTDGNHPTVAGSYLFALMLYGDLSRHSVTENTFVPKGLVKADAQVLRASVDEFLRLS